MTLQHAICSMQATALSARSFDGLSEEDLKFYGQINEQIMENTKTCDQRKERPKMNLQQKKDNSFLATEPLGKAFAKALSLPYRYRPGHQHAVQYCGPYLYRAYPGKQELWR